MASSKSAKAGNSHFDSLHLPNAENSPKLQQLKTALQRYHQSREGGRLKAHLYASLETLLCEAAFTRDHATRTRLIDKVHAWYLGKIQKAPSSQSPNAAQRRILQPIRQPAKAQSALPRPRHSKTYTRPKPVEFQQARDTQAFKRRMSAWGRRSSRWEEEHSRRIEQKHYFKQEPRAPRPRRGSVPLFDFREKLQSESPKAQHPRVAQLRRLHSQSLDVEPPTYDQASTSSLHHSFDTALGETRRSQVREVIETKRRLASRSISCSMRDLENGLLLPDLPVGSLPLRFPRGGEQLMMRPFTQVKKTAAKKKKGKKKKK